MEQNDKENEVAKKLYNDVLKMIDNSLLEFELRQYRIEYIKGSLWYNYIRDFLINNNFYKRPQIKNLMVSLDNNIWHIEYKTKKTPINFVIGENINSVIKIAELEFKQIYEEEKLKAQN